LIWCSARSAAPRLNRRGGRADLDRPSRPAGRPLPKLEQSCGINDWPVRFLRYAPSTSPGKVLGDAAYLSSIRPPHESKWHRRLYLQNLLCYGGDSARGQSPARARGHSRLRSLEIGSYENAHPATVPYSKLRHSIRCGLTSNPSDLSTD
jgi:hypothetical protein